MNLATRLFFAALALAIGVWVWIVFFPSPERVIHKRLEALASDVSFGPGQNYLSRLAHLQALSGFFTSNVELNVDLPGFQQHRVVGRDELFQAALGEQTQTRGLDAKFPDIHIVVAPDKLNAVADVTLLAQVSGQNDTIVQELKLIFQKVNGKWLIRRIETVRPLSWSGPPSLALNFRRQGLKSAAWLEKKSRTTV